jgi:hypothetical protein
MMQKCGAEKRKTMTLVTQLGYKKIKTNIKKKWLFSPLCPLPGSVCKLNHTEFTEGAENFTINKDPGNEEDVSNFKLHFSSCSL